MAALRDHIRKEIDLRSIDSCPGWCGIDSVQIHIVDLIDHQRSLPKLRNVFGDFNHFLLDYSLKSRSVYYGDDSYVLSSGYR